MIYYSTNNRNEHISLKEAVLKGMPDDKGLYMPGKLPLFPASFFHRLSSMTFQEISFEVARAILDDLPLDVLDNIIRDAFNFSPILHDLTDNVKILELFHGPTLAFKDFGARFMARLMAYFIQGSDETLNILVATSGDTGSAVANGFYKIPGVNVIILYPSGKISQIQEKQIATLDANIRSLEVAGTFDDCQRLVKTAFGDKELNDRIMLSSANSINIARLIPQSFYYFSAYAQLVNKNKKVAVSVPSGNFGNLTAGLMAKRMGLPIYKFIASTNANHIVPDYLESSVFAPKPSVKTISNAMDVGDPSNFVRMLDLYNYNWEAMKKDITGYWFDDFETREEIKNVYEKYSYILDPHGGVGSLGLNEFMKDRNDCTGIFLQTAHPAKFIEVIEPLVNTKIDIPHNLKIFLDKPKTSTKISSRYEDLKAFLWDRAMPISAAT